MRTVRATGLASETNVKILVPVLAVSMPYAPLPITFQFVLATMDTAEMHLGSVKLYDLNHRKIHAIHHLVESTRHAAYQEETPSASVSQDFSETPILADVDPSAQSAPIVRETKLASTHAAPIHVQAFADTKLYVTSSIIVRCAVALNPWLETRSLYAPNL